MVSVHTVVSFDFAVSNLPGWHATIFPPYFVAGAIYAGFAMVLTLAIPLRKFYGLEDFITMTHLENMAKVMLATGLIVAYGYTIEAFMAWYSGNEYEMFMMKNRMFGPYGWAYWLLILCNVVAPNLLWIKNLRTSVPVLFVMSFVVSIGMWLERFVIIVTSLHRDFLPSSWGMYAGTRYDWAAFIGTLGLFATLIFLFVRFLPAISIFEMRTLVPEAAEGREEHAVKPRTPIYGLLAEFRSPHEVVEAARRVQAAGYRHVDGYSPYPIEELCEALDLAPLGPAQARARGRNPRPPRGLGARVLGLGDRVPDEHRGPSRQLLARLHRPRLRDHDPLRGGDRGLRHAGAQRPPPALPPRLQRAQLRPRLARPLLHRHRGARPQVRPRGDEEVPARAWARTR